MNEITKEQYEKLANFDAKLKDQYQELRVLYGIPVFAIVGVLQKAIYNYQRTAEETDIVKDFK